MSLPPILLYPGSGLRPIQSGLGAEPWWDREVTISAGYSVVDSSGWVADYGCRRTFEAVVVHDMEGHLPAALVRWNTGAAGADLAILKDGSVVLVFGKVSQDAFGVVMWHAGTSNDPHSDTYGRTPFWRQQNINPHSVGIELEGYADARDGGYTLAQIRSVRRVALGLHRWFPQIPMRHTRDQIPGWHAHSELSALRADPGPTFHWAWLGMEP